MEANVLKKELKFKLPTDDRTTLDTLEFELNKRHYICDSVSAQELINLTTFT